MIEKQNVMSVETVSVKSEYSSPVATVETYSVERGFASSGSFESLSNSSNSYNDSNFT